MKWGNDTIKEIYFIYSHPQKDDIIAMYITRPSKDEGVMFSSCDTTVSQTMEESVLAMDHDSSDASMRRIQLAVTEKHRDGGNKSSGETPVQRPNMDETNRDAADVMDREGVDAGIKHMYEQAGGDYAKMRSMFG